MNYEEYAKTKDFELKCNPDLGNNTTFNNDWLLLNRDPEVGVFLMPKGSILIYDGYYNQSFEILPNELLGLIEEIGNIIPIGFNGNIYYVFNQREIGTLKDVVRFMDSVNRNR